MKYGYLLYGVTKRHNETLFYFGFTYDTIWSKDKMFPSASGNFVSRSNILPPFQIKNCIMCCILEIRKDKTSSTGIIVPWTDFIGPMYFLLFTMFHRRPKRNVLHSPYDVFVLVKFRKPYLSSPFYQYRTVNCSSTVESKGVHDRYWVDETGRFRSNSRFESYSIKLQRDQIMKHYAAHLRNKHNQDNQTTIWCLQNQERTIERERSLLK